ncbi:MAG TPA: hypothetical protein VKV26_24840 [Dehalococcoidia bacterium]|nr:hypothetical protein [Dehalococcoidia bacterium]
MEFRPDGGRAADCALALAVLLAACSSGNNKPARQSVTATSAVTASAAAARTASPAQTPANAALTPLPSGGSAAAAPAGSPLASATPPPALQPVSDRLQPLFLKTGDLPAALQTWNYAAPVGLANSTYVQGKPNAAQLSQQLDREGRLGTFLAAWGNGSGQQATLQTHAESQLQDVLALYKSPDAAATGCPFVAQEIQPVVQSPNGDVTTTTPLDLPAAGHEFKAYHIDYRYTAAVGAAGSGATARLQQVFLLACWRRGDVVATVQLGALNQEPSQDEFKQIVAAQDKRLTDAGLQ